MSEKRWKALSYSKGWGVVDEKHRRIANELTEKEAKLVAAAPELYDVLKRLVQRIEADHPDDPLGYGDILEEAGVLLERVEGKS